MFRPDRQAEPEEAERGPSRQAMRERLRLHRPEEAVAVFRELRPAAEAEAARPDRPVLREEAERYPSRQVPKQRSHGDPLRAAAGSHPEAAEEGDRRRDAEEAPRGRVRAGAACHAASGAAAAPCREEVCGDDAPTAAQVPASEGGRHRRWSTVPTTRCRDTTALFRSSWQVVLEVCRDKYTKNNCKIHACRNFCPDTNPAAARLPGYATNAPKRFMKRNNTDFISPHTTQYFEIKPPVRAISKQNEIKNISF